MKPILSIVLILALLSLAAYIVIFETDWIVQTELANDRLTENEVSDIIKTATAHRKAGQVREAIKVLKEALETDPDNFLLNLELGRAYEANKDIDLAISSYEKASEIEPGHYLPYKLLGYLYFNHKKDKSKAEKYLNKSLSLNDNQPDVKRFLLEMKSQPVAMPGKPNLPIKRPGTNRPIAPTPTVPDPRPRVPTIPGSRGR